jgi:hypothetical protein
MSATSDARPYPQAAGYASGKYLPKPAVERAIVSGVPIDTDRWTFRNT